MDLVVLWESLQSLNYLVVIGACLVSFVLGSLWYGPLFGKAWLKAEAMSKKDIEKGNMAKIITISTLGTLVAAITLATLLGGGDIGTIRGMWTGVILAIGLVGAMRAVHDVYHNKSLTSYLIHTGYDVVLFACMGAIIGSFA